MNLDKLSTAAVKIKVDKLKALEITTAQRNSTLSDLPALNQTLKDFEIYTW